MGRRTDPGWRDRAAFELLTKRVLATLPPEHVGPILLAGEPSRATGGATGMIREELHRWDRMASLSGPGQILPEASGVALAAVRMPRSRAALAFATRAAAGALRPGGLLLVYGASDEGTGAVERELADLGVTAQTWATGGRCRVVGGVLAEPPAPLAMKDVAERTELDLPHAGTRDWTSFPGVFAAGRLDGGTALLLRTIEHIDPTTRVLDYGAGTGVIGAVALALGAADVTLVEPDALAAEAARRNVPGANVVEARGWRALGTTHFDLILANPPYHQGKAETVTPVLDFLRGVQDHLSEGGSVRFVVQRRLRVEAPLRDLFSQVEVVADDGPFRVWEARA